MAKKRASEPRILVLGAVSRPVENAGGIAVQLDPHDDAERILEAVEHRNIDGLLLCGGTDVNPALYGAERHPYTQDPDFRRDRVEVEACEAALQRGIPVLGICRGSQLLNVTCGGTLEQHIGDRRRVNAGLHDWGWHGVTLEAASTLRRAMGATVRRVRSLHHQAVDEVAPDFRVVARSFDGVIEAIECKSQWALGVQFHPELASSVPGNQGIFEAFVDQAARQAGKPAPERIEWIPREWLAR